MTTFFDHPLAAGVVHIVADEEDLRHGPIGLYRPADELTHIVLILRPEGRSCSIGMELEDVDNLLDKPFVDLLYVIEETLVSGASALVVVEASREWLCNNIKLVGSIISVCQSTSLFHKPHKNNVKLFFMVGVNFNAAGMVD